MPLDEQAKAYNRQLLDLLIAMATVSSFEERRLIFRQEVHRAFDPEFFPSLLQLLEVMGAHPDKGQTMVFQILSAIALELREFLTPLDSESLGIEAICLEVVVCPLAADLNELAHVDDVDVGVALARTVIRREAYIQAKPAEFALVFNRLAEAAERRSMGKDTDFNQWIREEAERLRELPRRLQLMVRLLSLARTEDQPTMRADIQRHPPVDLFEAMSATTWLADALDAEGEVAAARGARDLMFVLMTKEMG